MHHYTVHQTLTKCLAQFMPIVFVSNYLFTKIGHLPSDLPTAQGNLAHIQVSLGYCCGEGSEYKVEQGLLPFSDVEQSLPQ